MRPIATYQNLLKFPLNELLSKEANVRLLRVLAEDVVGPIAVAEAAAKAGLTEAGARRAMRRLEKTGFVQRHGGGHSRQYTLRHSDQLTEQIMKLFQSERERYLLLYSQIRSVLEGFSEVKVSWIDTPPTKLGQPLHLGVQSDSRSLTYLAEQIRKRLVEIEDNFDLTIEIHTFSRADTPSMSWAQTEVLTGRVPEKSSYPARKDSGHAAKERRSARLSEAIANLIDNEPSIIKRAQKHLDALLMEDQGAAGHDLREWRDIITHYSPNRIRFFLMSNTPRAERLRQSSPFFAVLTADERDDAIAELENQS